MVKKGSQTMPNMDEKAANSGDRLKHTLLLEVLSRCSNWESLTYSETHAGAGIYHAERQKQRSQYIAELEATISNSEVTPQSVASGATYNKLLKTWWADPDHHGVYPGSVVQAATFLRQIAKA